MNVPFYDVRKLNARFRDAYIGALSSVIGGRSLILGDEVDRFERSWSAYCGHSYCVGVGNGYDALRIMLFAYGISHGDAVLVNANTHLATWLAVDSLGAVPVPVDVDEHGRMRVDEARRLAGQFDSAVILVTHMYGLPADMAGLRAIGLPLFVDAAHAHGLTGHLLGDAAAFSFYPTKNLGALGDAGAIVTTQTAVDGWSRQLRNYDPNITRSANSRLDELQAAFLNVKLPTLKAANERRRAIAYRYRASGVFLPLLPRDDNGCVYHQFPVRVRDRQAFERRMAASGIGTARHYDTVPYLAPAFAHLGYEAGHCPMAERLAQEVVSLPINPTLTDAQVDTVIAAVDEEASAA